MVILMNGSIMEAHPYPCDGSASIINGSASTMPAVGQLVLRRYCNARQKSDDG